MHNSKIYEGANAEVAKKFEESLAKPEAQPKR